MSKRILMCALAALLTGLAAAQTVQPQATQPNQEGVVPLYKVTVIGRTIPAVNYLVRGGKTSVALQGTTLLPDAAGKADVQVLQGATHIHVDFVRVNPAQRFGPEYLTYVLWAITPDGRANNLGEVMLQGQHATMDVTTPLQAYALVVTAEPYFGVTQPSDLVVMQNALLPDTAGPTSIVQAKAELLDRGDYRLNVPAAEISELPQDSRVPLDLYEGENAVRIARWMGAEQYAPEALAKAEAELKQAQGYQASNAGKTPVATQARAAVQDAEDARLLTLKRRDAEQVASAQAASDAQVAASNAQAAASAEQAAASAAQAQSAQVATQAAQQESADANAEREAAEAKARAADAAAASAQQAAQDAETQARANRAKLLVELNAVLQTRDTASGLIMNMSDVLFDFDKYTITPGAQVKLAKVSGILLSYPGLRIQVNGYTDSVGTDAYNQDLSDHRAAAVRDFLAAQGVNSSALTSQGFGKANPVASNDNAAGRQENRRVEMVVSGNAITATTPGQ